MDWNHFWTLFIDFWLFSERFIGRVVIFLFILWVLSCIYENILDRQQSKGKY